MKTTNKLLTLIIIFSSLFSLQSQNKFSKRKIENLKEEVSQLVEDDKKMTQVMIDKVFSFGELGFQEFETSKYLGKILEENGFVVEYQISGIPTSWLATWSNGEGGPTIALGSDFDGVPSTSQYPGVAYEKPVVEGAPGHGEGHNIGLPIVITSAIAIKKIMIENNINGKLVLWPGVAEEILGAKAWYVRDGYFDNVDMCIFTHVSTNMSTSWGRPSGTGLISVKYTFSGENCTFCWFSMESKKCARCSRINECGMELQKRTSTSRSKVTFNFSRCRRPTKCSAFQSFYMVFS